MNIVERADRRIELALRGIHRRIDERCARERFRDRVRIHIRAVDDTAAAFRAVDESIRKLIDVFRMEILK